MGHSPWGHKESDMTEATACTCEPIEAKQVHWNVAGIMEEDVDAFGHLVTGKGEPADEGAGSSYKKEIITCCCSITQSCPTLCDPMDCSTPGFPVLHHQLEFAQTQVHWVNDAIQPSHPLLSPSSPGFSLSQHLCFPVNQFFTLGGQSIGDSASASVLPMDIQSWFPLGLTHLISLQSKGLSRVFSNTTGQKHQFFLTQPSLFSHAYVTTGKTIALTRWTFVHTGMFLLFNMLSRFVVAFLPRGKRLLISWLQSPFTVIMEPRLESRLPGEISTTSDMQMMPH